MRRFSSALAAFLLGCTGAPRSVYSLTALDFSQRRDELATTSAPSCNGQPCLQVAKGDVLLISAAGSLQTTLGSVGPEGSASWGGSPFVFVNRPAFGLYGRINQSVFLIGREVVIIAPDSGTLEILVNGCTGTPPYTIDCSTSGSFSVSMFTNLKPEVTIASTPELTDNSIVGTDLTSVSASDPWQDTGIELKKGQKVLLSASGTFSAGGYGQLSADGEPGGMNGGAPYLLVNRFAYRLYGRVDQNVIELGAEASFLSPATGRLELAINQSRGRDRLAPGVRRQRCRTCSGPRPSRHRELEGIAELCRGLDWRVDGDELDSQQGGPNFLQRNRPADRLKRRRQRGRTIRRRRRGGHPISAPQPPTFRTVWQSERTIVSSWRRKRAARSSGGNAGGRYQQRPGLPRLPKLRRRPQLCSVLVVRCEREFLRFHARAIAPCDGSRFGTNDGPERTRAAQDATDAGRSTTSQAAIWLISSSERTAIRPMRVRAAT